MDRHQCFWRFQKLAELRTYSAIPLGAKEGKAAAAELLQSPHLKKKATKGNMWKRISDFWPIYPL